MRMKAIFVNVDAELAKRRHICRYCAYLVTSNGIYCGELNKEMGEKSAKKPNKCKHFLFCEFDSFQEKDFSFEKENELRQKLMMENRSYSLFDKKE